MIDTTLLEYRIHQYYEACKTANKQPSYTGLGTILGISGMTVKHIVTGLYKDGHRYTNKPHSTRCVDNADFDLIRALFDDRHI